MAISRKAFVRTFISITAGTFLEWFDFSAFAALDHIIKKLFHVSGTMYWAIFALGFISRPVGAILFGWIGDTVGRRMSLVLSVVGVAIPSTLVGCLPTYDMIGIAAPILLAILRLAQGLALGGEFSGALVYIQEVAPLGWESTLVNTMASSSKFAVIAGNLTVIVLEAALTQQQLFLWGWRIPFLSAVITGGVALVMRRTMPESEEFQERRSELKEEAAVATLAAAHSRQLASINSRQLSATQSGHLAAVKAQPLVTIDSMSKDAEVDLDRGLGPFKAGAAPQGGLDDRPLARAGSLSLARSVTLKVAHSLESAASHATFVVTEAATSHKVPLLDVVVLHGHTLLLHIMFLIFNACLYYTVTTWVPSTLRTAGVKPMLTQAMLIVNLVLVLGVAILAGYALDRGWKSMHMALAASVAATGISFAMCALIPRTTDSHLAPLWLVMAAMSFLTGVMNGQYPLTGVTFFPPECRLTAMNLGYNLAYGCFGGLTPMAITAITKAARQPVSTFAASWWLLAVAGVSWVAMVVLMFKMPWVNYTRTQQQKKRILPPWMRKSRHSMRYEHAVSGA